MGAPKAADCRRLEEGEASLQLQFINSEKAPIAGRWPPERGENLKRTLEWTVASFRPAGITKDSGELAREWGDD